MSFKAENRILDLGLYLPIHAMIQRCFAYCIIYLKIPVLNGPTDFGSMIELEVAGFFVFRLFKG